MLNASPIDVFRALVEGRRVTRFTSDLLEGSGSPDVQALKRQWRTDALIRQRERVEQHNTLCATFGEVASLANERKNLQTAMNMQWLLTRVAEYLVNRGSVPPAWDGNTKPPSFDHALLFLDSSARSHAAVSAPLDDPHLLRELRFADTSSLYALDWYFPPEIDGRMKLMCLKDYHNVPAMKKAIDFIGYEDVDIVPYSDHPTGAPTVSCSALHTAATDAVAAGHDIDKIQDEIVALTTESSANSKLIEEKRKQLSEARDAQTRLCSRVLALCKAFIADAEHEPLRPFLYAQFLLSRVAQTFVGTGFVPCHWDENYRGPIFDHVLKVLHSTESDAASVENRKHLRATFTDSDWQFFTDLNNECFNALFNSEPPRVDGYLQLSSEANCVCREETLTKVAEVLKLDFLVVSARSANFIRGSALPVPTCSPITSLCSTPSHVSASHDAAKLAD